MLLSLFYSIVFFLQAILTPGANRINGKHVKVISAKINCIAYVDSVINESSTLVKPNKDFDLFFTLNDSGGKPEVFAIDGSGKLIDTKVIPEAKNVDWEEIVYYQDSVFNPHIVIGDIGNNRNQRKNLCLYDYDVTANSTTKKIFSYQDQYLFPPSEDSLNYDCEAFFRRDSSYYFISKNRGKGFVKIYQLPQDTTAHVAIVKQRLQFKGMVTACSVYKDDKTKVEKLAVLLYGRIFLFMIHDSSSGIQLQPYGVVKFPSCGQSEGICWYGANELRATNEKGKLFKIALKR
jgi:hypothetical protein